MAVIMANNMPRNTGMALQFELQTLSESPEKTDTVMKCLKRIKLLLQEKREHMHLSNEADEYCYVIDEKDKILRNAGPTVGAKATTVPNYNSAKCQACGMLNHTRKTCAFNNHELANRTTYQWDYSPRGKLWATHNKPCLTIGYTIPGHQPIRHSDGHYPKPNPYAKSYSQTNSSNGKYRQNNNNNNNNSNNNSNNSNNNNDNNNNNNNNHNHNHNNNHNNNNNNTSNRNNSTYNNSNRDNSNGYNSNRYNNNRDRSADRSADRSVTNDNKGRSSTYFDNVNKNPRSKSDTDFSAICSAVSISCTF
jgi:hypothetical protein